MPCWKHYVRCCLLLGLMIASAGCQLFPTLGLTPKNSHGVPYQSEPDIQFEEYEE